MSAQSGIHIDSVSNNVSPLDVARALHRERGFVWLDGDGGSEPGRYSYLSCRPVEEIVVSGGRDPLSSLPKRSKNTCRAGELLDAPQWIGYLSYDSIWSIARSAAAPRKPPRHRRNGSTPSMELYRYDAMARFDHQEHRWLVVADSRSAAQKLIGRVESASRRPLTSGACDSTEHEARVRSTAPSEHATAIAKALEAIATGQIYQINLARRFEADYLGEPFRLFENMRRHSPVPLGFFLQTPHAAILGRSMETFLRFSAVDRYLQTRPIKGTCPREPLRVFSLKEATKYLQTDPKEHAEHSMIVDLMRNDLARVAEVGSVRVAKSFDIQEYKGLYHMVSTVECAVPKAIDAETILRATFPPGSISGTPKTNALDWIEALEPGPRGIYCGVMGYFDRQGGFHLAVAIRTAVVSDGVAEYWSGGGIVSASQTARELEETEVKARTFLNCFPSERRNAVDRSSD
ncbi:MAG: anthranilate synthase component I family protein [Myxococcota bacterium]